MDGFGLLPTTEAARRRWLPLLALLAVATLGIHSTHLPLLIAPSAHAGATAIVASADAPHPDAHPPAAHEARGVTEAPDPSGHGASCMPVQAVDRAGDVGPASGGCIPSPAYAPASPFDASYRPIRRDGRPAPPGDRRALLQVWRI